jgi:renalase
MPSSLAQEISDVLIVGAGISGLCAALELGRWGARIKIVDKSRGVGGRMATRRWNKARFDHGVQFFTFTLKNNAFAVMLSDSKNRAAVKLWSDGFPDSDGKLPESFRGNRYCGTHAMTDVAKALAQELPVVTSFKVNDVRPENGVWKICSEEGATLRARALLFSAPLPQSVAILDASHFSWPLNVRETFARVTYEPCFALLATLAGKSKIPPPGAVRVNGERLSWIADNFDKGVSGEVGAVTLLASGDFSKKEFETPFNEVARMLLEDAKPWLGSPVNEWQIHRWRYSRPENPLSDSVLLTGDFPTLAFCGDAFSGARVESAALTGISAAQKLAPVLKLIRA